MSESNTPACNSVQRACEILELLDSCPRYWTISEIGRKLEIPKSTVHVLALTLEKAGYLARPRNARGYALGLKAYALGRGIAPKLVLPKIGEAQLRALVEITGLTAHLAVLEGDQALYIHKIEGGSVVFDFRIGKHTNLHCTAVGKVLLAWTRPEFLSEYLARGHYTRHTVHTITTASELRRELLKVKKQGFAVDDQEEELEVRCLAAPVKNHHGECVAALGVVGTTEQLRPENQQFVLSLIRQSASRISAGIPRSSSLS